MKTFAQMDIYIFAHKTFAQKTIAQKDICPERHMPIKTFAQKYNCSKVILHVT
jgi:hypothetical protein